MFIILSFLSSLITTNAHAIFDPFSITCQNSYWIGTPALNSSGNLVANLGRQCTVELNVNGSIAALDRNRLRRIPIENQVHKGPFQETYRSLPSVKYDVTSKVAESGEVNIRSNLHLATDQKTKILINFESIQISGGTGNAKFLRKCNLDQEITQDAIRPNIYHLKVTQMVEIEKPWYAPESIFISQAKENLNTTFVRTVNTFAHLTAKEQLLSDLITYLMQVQ